jgi:hypothetical protein
LQKMKPVYFCVYELKKSIFLFFMCSILSKKKLFYFPHFQKKRK